MPRLDLHAFESGIGVEERRSHVGPQRFARKVSDMKLVPRIGKRLAGKGSFRIVTRLDNFAAQGLKNEPLGNKYTSQARVAERCNGEMLFVCLDLKYLVGQQSGLLFEIPNGTSDRKIGFERRKFIPAPEPAMRLKGGTQQIIHELVLV